MRGKINIALTLHWQPQVHADSWDSIKPGWEYLIPSLFSPSRQLEGCRRGLQGWLMINNTRWACSAICHQQIWRRNMWTCSSVNISQWLVCLHALSRLPYGMSIISQAPEHITFIQSLSDIWVCPQLIIIKLNWIPATFWRKLEQYKHCPFYLWEQRDGVLYFILSTNTQICEDDPVLQMTWSGGSLSRWVTTAHTSVHFLLPTTRVIFAAISSCRNIALIPILSVAARFGSLWSLNNFAGLCFPPHCICISLLPCLLSSQLGYLPSCNLFVMAYPYCLLLYTHTLCQKATTHKCLVTRTTIGKLEKLVSDYI